MSHRRSKNSPGRNARVLLGQAIRAMRIRAKLSQEELAGRVGKEHSYISRVESGDQALEVVALIALLEASGVEPEVMIEELMALLRESRKAKLDSQD